MVLKWTLPHLQKKKSSPRRQKEKQIEVSLEAMKIQKCLVKNPYNNHLCSIMEEVLMNHLEIAVEEVKEEMEQNR